MQIRAITIKGKRPTPPQMLAIVRRLQTRIAKAGFLTSVFQVNASRIDIKGGHSGVSNVYATINVAKRGHNYRVNSFTAHHCKLGYKRTNVLTWDQRVELNNLINDVLDGFKVTATIASRGFTVRTRDGGRVNSWEIPAYSSIGDSFQHNYHDWIYAAEYEAVAAVVQAYPSRRVHVNNAVSPPRITVTMNAPVSRVSKATLSLVRGGAQ